MQAEAQRGQNIQNFLRKNCFLVKYFARILFPSYSLFEKIEASQTANKGLSFVLRHKWNLHGTQPLMITLPTKQSPQRNPLGWEKEKIP